METEEVMALVTVTLLTEISAPKLVLRGPVCAGLVVAKKTLEMSPGN